MLTWTWESLGFAGSVHKGTMNGELYAVIAVAYSGQAFTQFKGLDGADIDSDGARVSPDLETAKKICEVMMKAWAHKAN